MKSENRKITIKRVMRALGSAIFGLIWLVLAPSAVLAQMPIMPVHTGEPPEQSIYLEGGGNAILASLNYDILFENNFGIRMGISGQPSSRNNTHPNRRTSYDRLRDTPFFFFVLMGNYFIGEGSNKLELGAGLLLGEIEDDFEWNRPGPTSATFTVGYRFMPQENRFPVFRIGATPLFDFKGNSHLRFGVSLGFKI